jgi:hypothetical protein
MKVKFLLEFTGIYWLSRVKITVDISHVCHWVIKSRDIGRTVDLNDQPRSARLVSTTHVLNRQKFDDNQLQDLCEDPKEAETTNKSRSSGKKN